MAHVWEGSRIYKKLSRTLWRSKPVSRDSCVRSDMVEHISCLQAQCTDVMGSYSRWCRIIMDWSASAKVQACRAFQIKRGRGQMHLEGIYIHHMSNNTRIHANHVREYESQLWNIFLSFRTLQRSLIQTATLYNTVHGAIFIPYIHNSRRRHPRKKSEPAIVSRIH